MTLHRRAWRVVCHYCGLKRPYSETCPVCDAADCLEEHGKGTERIEDQLAVLFPNVPMARMDADTTSGRGAHERILTAFRNRETQLLVGTQIVAKGHDFPDVQTAVVISADRGFRMPDFRAAERTWALLVQVAGRAGRGEHPGRVLVQTWDPDHYVLQSLDDPPRFYAAELRIRQMLSYPPHSRLCLVRVSGVNRQAVRSAAESLGRELRQSARHFTGISLTGPAPAALPRLVGRWRWQLVIRGTVMRAWLQFLHQHQRRIRDAGVKGVRVAIDVDPRHLM
jgi:primosomal protein N' (replication factor Y)